MAFSVGELFVRIAVKGKAEFQNSLKSMSNTVKNFASSVEMELKIAAAAFAAFGALAVKEAADLEKTMLALSVVTERTGRDFNETKKLISKLQQEMGGLATKAEIAQASLRLMTTSLSTDQILRFIQAIQDGSVAAGTDFATNLDTVTRGFLQLNTASLDNIKVNFRLNDLYSRTADQLGKTRDQLTNADIELAIFNETLKQQADFVGIGALAADTFSGAINQMRVKFSEAAAEIGEELLPELNNMLDFIEDNGDTIAGIGETISDALRLSAIAAVAVVKSLVAIVGAVKKLKEGDFKGSLDELKTGLSNFVDQGEKAFVTAADLVGIQLQNSAVTRETAESVNELADADRNAAEAADQRAKSVGALTQELIKLNKISGEELQDLFGESARVSGLQRFQRNRLFLEFTNQGLGTGEALNRIAAIGTDTRARAQSLQNAQNIRVNNRADRRF